VLLSLQVSRHDHVRPAANRTFKGYYYPFEGHQERKAWQVIHFLVAERRIVMNDVGMISKAEG
jgi:hypothetical protein